MLDALDAVTADDLQRVARGLVEHAALVAVIGPTQDAERFEQLVPRDWRYETSSTTECAARLGYGFTRGLDRADVLRVALAHLERPLERLERLLVSSPTSRSSPNPVVSTAARPSTPAASERSTSSSPRVVHVTNPSRSGAASARVRRVAREPVITGRDRRGVRRLEERRRGLFVPAERRRAAALQIDADTHAWALLGHLVEPVALVEQAAQAGRAPAASAPPPAA